MRAAIGVEILKVGRARILWISAVVALVFPLLIALVMSGAIGADSAIEVEASAESYLMQYELIVAIGGLIGFGFLFSWIFGREWADGTITDLLSLPTARSEIVAAKFVVIVVWCIALATVHFAVGTTFTWATFPEATTHVLWPVLRGFALTTLMVTALSTPVAFAASAGRGFLAPLGYVILTIIAAQLVGVFEAGRYFPWAVPALRSGIAGEAMREVGWTGLVLPFVVGAVGVVATVGWWRYHDA